MRQRQQGRQRRQSVALQFGTVPRDATGVPQPTVNAWLIDFGKSAIFDKPPGID